MCLAAAGNVIELKQQGKLAVVEFAKGEKREMQNIVNAEKGQRVLVQQAWLLK